MAVNRPAGNRSIERATGVRFYFATPHHAWECGTSENTNGLIRKYVPKGRNMATLTQRACDRIADTLTRRPRKRLYYQDASGEPQCPGQHRHRGQIAGELKLAIARASLAVQRGVRERRWRACEE